MKNTKIKKKISYQYLRMLSKECFQNNFLFFKNNYSFQQYFSKKKTMANNAFSTTIENNYFY